MSHDTVIGKPLDRVEGHQKVTGQAQYSAETPIANLTHGVFVESTIAHGRITDIQTQAAENAPGVHAVFTHRNTPEIGETEVLTPGAAGQKFLPMQSDRIEYAGQHIALVIADTLEQATYAASLVDVQYEADEAVTALEDALDQAYDIELPFEPRGDPDQSFADAPVKIDAKYTTPVNHHNPIEPLTTTAVWDGKQLTVYTPTQWVLGTQYALADQLQLSHDQVRVVSKYVGGSFGCKISCWPHTTLAALATRELDRPVNVELTRAQMYSSNGYRTPSNQRVRVGASEDGELAVLIHDAVTQTPPTEDWVEFSLLSATSMLYECPDFGYSYQLAPVNMSKPTFMRAPGEAQGTFALESAIDELAVKLEMDPLDLRLENYAETIQGTDLSWSSKALRSCYQQGANRFGWNRRTHQPRSMRNGDQLIGWGMATATYPTVLSPASARIQLAADGSVRVQTAVHEMGNGVRTALAMIAAETLGISPERVDVEIGDTTLPKSPDTSGSRTTASVGHTVQTVATAVRSKLIDLAVSDEDSPLSDISPEKITVERGRMISPDDSEMGETYQELLQRQGRDHIEEYRETVPPGTDDELKQQTFSGHNVFALPLESHSYGAHFCEVTVDADLGSIGVTQYVGAFDGGRIINQKTAESQLRGGIIMGIGMALLEATITDSERDHIVNTDLEEYIVPTNADVPHIDAFFVETEDPDSPLGVKSVGEVGMVGAAAAVANAVYHATGTRVRSLPITLDDVL